MRICDIIFAQIQGLVHSQLQLVKAADSRAVEFGRGELTFEVDAVLF